MDERAGPTCGQDWLHHPNPFLSIAGRDKTAPERLAFASAQGFLPLRLSRRRANSAPPLSYDYAQIDPLLPIERGEIEIVAPEPEQGRAGYGSLTPSQRTLLFRWFHDVTQPVSDLFQNLYLAHLECALLDSRAEQACQELRRLAGSESWRANRNLARSLLLAGWLAQSPQPIAEAILSGRLDAEQMETALAWQAMLRKEVDADQIRIAAATWNLVRTVAIPMESQSLQIALKSMRASLGQDPIQYALESAKADPSSESQWHPWRAVHRDLRMELPQPTIRTTAEPLLTELLTFAPTHLPAVVGETDNRDPGAPREAPAWSLVLEFGVSRSDWYEFVLASAQELPGYRLLMDENRQLVHRIRFDRSGIRQFWALWDSVQGWSSTRVFLNGEELQRWKIWPYSPYLR